jgi:hypothetical protein
MRPSATSACAQGELLRRGEIYREGLARVVSGDDMGFRADFNSGLVIFYKVLSLLALLVQKYKY